MEGFPSGQREQTVNLSSMTSVVRIHHLPPKRKDIPKGMSFLLWRKAGGGFESRLLETCQVARFNRRGFAAAKRIHHRTGRHACGSATMGGNSQSRQARAQSEGKSGRSMMKSTSADRFVTDILSFAMLSRRGRKIIRFVGEHSDSLRAAYGGCSLDAHCGGCVRPYGIYGAKPCLSTKQSLRFHHLTKPERPFIILI